MEGLSAMSKKIVKNLIYDRDFVEQTFTNAGGKLVAGTVQKIPKGTVRKVRIVGVDKASGCEIADISGVSRAQQLRWLAEDRLLSKQEVKECERLGLTVSTTVDHRTGKRGNFVTDLRGRKWLP
jgi:hypothetical protein